MQEQQLNEEEEEMEDEDDSGDVDMAPPSEEAEETSVKVSFCLFSLNVRISMVKNFQQQHEHFLLGGKEFSLV